MKQVLTMKKSALINSELSYLVSTLGHTDEVTICDAGLPIAEEVQRIDLALTHGVPASSIPLKSIYQKLRLRV
ncbi:ribose ABC transport system high affinity permease RbsD [Vibrio variabilis]|uniref:D-ribose pyranase n=1 Tax=Vibrio variabilis TaxID=990271 RepID=A0ABQ0JE68_9VIBR|nr:ribose ABC transport system high affinity permease RbsD [Vibrio variabilis]